jgi:hypothetical protein
LNRSDGNSNFAQSNLTNEITNQLIDLQTNYLVIKLKVSALLTQKPVTGHDFGPVQSITGLHSIS